MIEAEIWGNKISLHTREGLFSPNHTDPGTLAMLTHTEVKQDDKVLDLGCGCGIVGIAAAKVIGGNRVFMADCDPAAVETSRENASLNDVPEVTIAGGDGLNAFPDEIFTLILCNPPYHTDFSVARKFIDQGFRHLIVGGRIIFVVKRLDWYRNKLRTVFGNVSVMQAEGYFILKSIRNAEHVIIPKEKSTTRKHLKKIAVKRKGIAK